MTKQPPPYILCTSVAFSFGDLQHALPFSAVSSISGPVLFLHHLPSWPTSLVIVSHTSQVCNLYMCRCIKLGIYVEKHTKVKKKTSGFPSYQDQRYVPSVVLGLKMVTSYIFPLSLLFISFSFLSHLHLFLSLGIFCDLFINYFHSPSLLQPQEVNV